MGSLLCCISTKYKGILIQPKISKQRLKPSKPKISETFGIYIGVTFKAVNYQDRDKADAYFRCFDFD